MFNDFGQKGNLFNLMLNSEAEFTSEQRVKFKNLWKELEIRQRMGIIQTTIFQINISLKQQQRLDKPDEIRLAKLLSIQFNIEEAININLGNHVQYTSELMRQYGINIRSILNQITDVQSRIESMLLKSIEERIKDFRKLEPGGKEEQEQDDNDYYYPKKTHQKEETSKDYYEEHTKVERSQIIYNQSRSANQHDNLNISFSRVTKINKPK